MSDFSKPLADPADDYYTRFEQNLALAWAQAHLTDFLRVNPHCSEQEKTKYFLDAVEGGLSLALEYRKRRG